MLFNTSYFRVLCQSESISSAAEKLHVSHQNLSKYIQNLEREYGMALFIRAPKLTLTEAGKAVLESMQDIAIIEQNLQTRLMEIRHSDVGTLRVGAPEGRFRVVFPKIMARMRERYPRVRVKPLAAPSYQLRKLLLLNELDVALMDQVFSDPTQFRSWAAMEEKLYLVVSDELLKQYFPKPFPAGQACFEEGVDLTDFLDLPFILNSANSISRRCVDEWLLAHERKIQPVLELPQLDVQILLSACNYGACFCWSMYLPLIEEQNRLHMENPLHVFPLRAFSARNQILLVSLKNKTLPAYGKAFCQLVRESYERFVAPGFLKTHSIMLNRNKKEE